MAGCPIGITTSVAAGLLGCYPDSSPQHSANIVTDTIGDTIVTRTLRGGVWDGVAELVPDLSVGQGMDGPEEYTFGSIASLAVDDDGNIYVLDGQAQDLRVFDAEGTYLTTLARRGRGPGELARAEAMALLPDRRVVVRDPENARVQVLGSEPDQTTAWRYQAANHRTYTPLWTRGGATPSSSLMERTLARSTLPWTWLIIHPPYSVRTTYGR